MCYTGGCTVSHRSKGIAVIHRLLGTLYIQVLIGIVLGLLVGALWPETGAALKPLGDAFIKLIKMVIAPVIFCTVAPRWAT